MHALGQRRMTWLNIGTVDSRRQAAFNMTSEKLQGIKVGCPEAATCTMGEIA